MIAILVVVPTLNSYRDLPDLVTSIKNQTYKNWRVLFIDGNSDANHQKYLEFVCEEDDRFKWITQLDNRSGIYGAMNQGFLHAHPKNDWILFWGSDDRASSPDVFTSIVSRLSSLESKGALPDLYICVGQYFTSSSPSGTNQASLKKTRVSRFYFKQSLRSSLFWGSTPAHQATLFGPGARRHISRYSSNLRIAGDLDYFLRLSRFPEARIVVDNHIIVLMGDAGISGRQTQQRLKEVINAYKQAFGLMWITPFVLRYVGRFFSLVGS